MNGIEKITARIDADTQAEIDRILGDAHAQAEAIAAKYRALAAAEVADLLVRRLSHAQIGAVSAPICAFYHRSFGGFSIVSVQPRPLFSDSGSKVGQARCARTHSNSVSSSIAPEATARPTSTTSSLVQSSRIPLTSRAELIYD